ncbi:MAG: hypothetical protein JO026_00115 [Patescibacteria group bacterium]|nr:hypothetical protein [Patescibacteria group bacterium]
MNHRYLAASAILAGVASFAIPLISFAASTGLSIQPVKVYQTIAPGDSAEGNILLTNASDGDIDVEVSVQDFIPESGTDSINFVAHAPGVTSVKDWVTIGGKQTFVFKKGESRTIPYTITVPKDAEPGSHFGVAFFKAVDLVQAQAGLKIGTQVGMLILITVPGDYSAKGQITSFSAPSFVQGSPVPFDLTFENDGSVYYIPDGTITITNMFGKVVGTAPIQGQVVLPTGVRKIHSVWQTSDLLMGWYTASTMIKGPNGEHFPTRQVSFFALPVWYIFWFLVSVAILFILFSFLRRRVKFSVSLK